MHYKNEAAFINRQDELHYLKNWIAEQPKHILFLYGPKSSGKTTLIYKFVERYLSDERTFSIKLFNLREVLLVNYEDFLQRFFQLEEPKEETSRQARHYDLKVFKLTVENQKKIRNRQLDPFDVMKTELQELNIKGIRPIIIIDELQALDFVYFNGQRELLKELLNFFVAMTKESHLCHVLLSSSDGYFIEKLYNDSKLKKTSDLLEVDYLPKEDIVYWLNNLKKESRIEDYILTDYQIQYIWDHFGGSIWEISRLLGDFLRVSKDGEVSDKEMENIVARHLIQARSYFMEYASIDERKIALLKRISEIIHKQNFFFEPQLSGLAAGGIFKGQGAIRNELDHLVRRNFLYYNPAKAEYKLQGRSMEIGLDRYVRDIEGLMKGK